MSGGYSYDQTDDHGNRLKIAEGRIIEDVLVEIHDQEGNTLGTLVPRAQRWFAAQAVAGADYDVIAVGAVPADHACEGTARNPDKCTVCGNTTGRVLAGSVTVKGLTDTINELIQALRLTVEYVGCDMLPAVPGWSWYDALAKHAPDVLRAMTPSPENVILAHYRVNPNDDAGTCLCGWDEADGDSPSRSHALHVWERMQRNGVIRRGELE